MCTSLVGLFSCIKAQTGKDEVETATEATTNPGQMMGRRRPTMTVISNDAILQRNRLMHRSNLPPPPQPPQGQQQLRPTRPMSSNTSCIRPLQCGRQSISYEALQRHDQIFGPGSVKDINEQF